MKETVEVSEKGREDMERVGEALGNIEVSIHNLETAVNKVGTASGEIVQIINLIGEIADETNLLSLNASIEAPEQVRPVRALRLLRRRLVSWLKTVPNL